MPRGKAKWGALRCATMTRIGRRDAGWDALLAEAIDAALSHGGGAAPEALYLAAFAPRALCSVDDPLERATSLVARRTGARPARARGPFLTGGAALFAALADRAAERVRGDALVVGVEKMTHRRAAEAAGRLAPRVIAPLEHAHGATLPALAALAASAWARRWRVPLSAFDLVAVKNHEHARRNPRAHFRRRVTPAEVAASPLVADPLRRLHCAPMSDGAAACLLGEEGDVHVTGFAHGRDAPLLHARREPWRFDAATAAARAALSMARRRPADVDVVEIHDAFSPFEPMNLEAMGFFAPGTSWRALRDGQLHVGGRLAVNPSGGMKARGHPIGVCGLTSVAELVEQLTGRSGDRQQPGARTGLVQSAGGVSRDTFVFVLEAAS